MTDSDWKERRNQVARYPIHSRRVCSTTSLWIWKQSWKICGKASALMLLRKRRHQDGLSGGTAARLHGAPFH